MSRFGVIRDVGQWILGVGIIIYEAGFEHGDRPWMVLAGLSLIFGVVFLPSGIVDGFEIKRKKPRAKK